MALVAPISESEVAPLRLSGGLTGALAFVVGLQLARVVGPSPLLWVMLCLPASAVAWRVGHHPRIGPFVVCLAIALAAASWHDVRLTRLPRDSVDHFARFDQPRLVRVVGVVESAPRVGSPHRGDFAPYAYQPAATRLSLRVEAALDRAGQRTAASGRLVVRIDEATHHVHAGQRVMITGMLRPPPPPGNPGEGDQLLHARQAAVAGTLSCPRSTLVEPLDEAEGRCIDTLRRCFEAFRAGARARASGWLMTNAFQQDGPYVADARALVAALVLGERTIDSAEVTNAFRRVGLAHLLSISGLHLGLLAAIVAWSARALGGSRRLEFVLVTLTVLAYLFLVPARTPVLRAAIMIVGFVIAECAGRRLDRVAVLSVIAVIVLIWRPLDLWSAGFQLSFGTVAGLLLLAEPFRCRLFGHRPEPDALSTAEHVGERLKSLVAVSTLAWLLATPLIACHFQTLCPLAIFLSIVTFPLAAAVLLIGFLMILTATIWPSLGVVSGPLLTLLAETLASLVIRVDAIPLASTPTPLISWRWAVAALATVGYTSLTPRPPALRTTAMVTIVVGWLMIGSAPPHRHCLTDDVVLRIDALAVGDGGCMIIRSRSATVMWDCGSLSDLAIGEDAAVPALRAMGLNHIDHLFISHPNLDHYSGVLEVVRSFPVSQVHITHQLLVQAAEDPLGPTAHLLDQLDALDTPVSRAARGASWRLDDTQLRLLHPPPRSLFGSNNASSMVLRIDAADRVVLLCGDIEGEGLAQLRADHPDLRADVIEAPHHGSRHPEVVEFVTSLDPRIVIQSSSLRRDPSVWQSFAKDRTWFHTAHDGATQVEILEDGRLRHGAWRTD